MRIESSNISLASRRQMELTRSRSERLKVWIGDAGPGASAQAGIRNGSGGAAARDAAAGMLRAGAAGGECERCAEGKQGHPKGDMSGEIILVEMMVEIFTGRKVKITVPDIGHSDGAGDPQALPHGDAAPAQDGRVGWGLEYDYSSNETERESLRFAVSGIVKTADGHEFSVTLNLSLDRSFVQESSLRVRAGNAPVDPLVINFDGTAAQLSEGTFAFDLNLDGRQEQVPLLRPGSGFLVLDKNADGKVNDGGELFGPRTGEGFAELGEHDADGNGWIDEADPVFTRLGVWTADPAGEGSLVSLSEKGVGAIHLGTVSAQFSLKDQANTLLGESKRAGVYLREDGTPGVLQELDLVA